MSRYPGLPSDIYHYTSLEGFEGIVESGALWATRTCHLNDRTEIEHGRALALEVADELMKTLGESDPTAFIRERLADEQPDNWRTDEYFNAAAVASLTELGDDLSQWRAYGAQGHGLCIAFDAREIHALATTDHVPVSPAFSLLRVRYDDAAQRELLREMFDYFTASFEKEFADPECESDPLDACYVRAVAFCAALATFKHPSFAAEDEWRLATFVLGDLWSLRSGDVEYVAVSLVDGFARLPIREVILGPCCSESDEERVQAALQASPYCLSVAIPIRRSAVPLRC
jgi:hypothetical protein